MHQVTTAILRYRWTWPKLIVRTVKLEPTYLSSMVQFTEEVPIDVKWSLVLQSLRPHYVHLFESDVTEFNLLAAWLLAKITHRGNAYCCRYIDAIEAFNNEDCRVRSARVSVPGSSTHPKFGKSDAPPSGALLVAVQEQHGRSGGESEQTCDENASIVARCVNVPVYF